MKRKFKKQRTRAVDGWIQSVEAMEKDVNDLSEKSDEETQKKCFGTSCSLAAMPAKEDGGIEIQCGG